jgi:hypothetical protein
MGISPSTFTRMARGCRPDVDTFATLVRWLGVSADVFMTPAPASSDEADPLTIISTYLRMNRNLTP